MAASPHATALETRPAGLDDGVLHATIQLLHDFYPDHTSPVASTTQSLPTERGVAPNSMGRLPEAVTAVDCVVESRVASSKGSASSEKNSMVVAVEGDVDDGVDGDGVSPLMCGIVGSPCFATAQFPQMELPFLSIAAQERQHAGRVTSDDADEHTPLARLLVLMGRLAGPVAATQVLRGSMSLITTVFMGHSLSTEQLAAATAGLMFTNLTALNIGSGFSAAQRTHFAKPQRGVL